jgi:tetratricopeptide (TPR) repeat protein
MKQILPISTTPSQKGGTPASRHRFFFFFTLLFPFLLVATLEFSLRVAGYGSGYDLIIRRRINGVEYYSVNRSVGHRYFAQPGSIVPEPGEDTFTIAKKKNTRRIFCLGESTMAGFPYELHATPASLLRDRLQAMLPQYHIEVVNVALSAVGSYVVEDFIGELQQYEPDLFVVYAGHNEFYGIYGAGSSISIPGGEWATRFTLSLQKSRSFQLARSAYFHLLGWFSKSPTGPSPSLMGQMVGNQEILYHDRTYQRARAVYADNLRRIIGSARAMNVPILFSTLVSNWRDQRPFVSAFDPAATEGKRALWRMAMASGDSSMAHNQPEDALVHYRNATQIDSMNAQAFFSLGTVFYAIGRYDEAKLALLRAKDRDALRFRASEEFERDLEGVCAGMNVPLAHTDSAFAERSPHGILDNHLFLEHLHPNVDGYFLFAKTLAGSIMANRFLVSHSEWLNAVTVSDSLLVALSGITDFDRTIGKVKVDLLKRRWPFETGIVNYEFVPANPVESVVFRMMKGGMTWSDARYLLAEYYAQHKLFSDARKECRAVAKALPFFYEPLLRYADYFVQEGLVDSAKAAYQQCIKVDDNPFAHLKLGALWLEEDVTATAVAQIQAAFAVQESTPYRLSKEAASLARYLLGVGYAKMGQMKEARYNLQMALAIQPDYNDAANLLRQIEHRK